MNDLKRKILTIFIIVLLICGSYYFGRYQIINKYRFINVPCANRLINCREQIKNKDIKYVSVPSSILNDNAITDDIEIIGKYVSAYSFINEGELFYKTCVEDISEMNDAYYFELSGDEVIYELFVKNIDVNVAHINKNMYVDLYLTIEKPNIVSDLLISGAKICGLYSNDYNEFYTTESNKKDLGIISLVVTSEVISILNKAQLIGRISIIPSKDIYNNNELYINKEGDVMKYIN